MCERKKKHLHTYPSLFPVCSIKITRKVNSESGFAEALSDILREGLHLTIRPSQVKDQ